MACLLVPAAEAVITTVITKVIKSKEKEEEVQISLPDGSVCEATRIRFSSKLGWLNKMLFPFLTAVENGETAEMLAEMGSAGVTMAVLVTVVWGGMLAVSSIMEKKALRAPKLTKEGI